MSPIKSDFEKWVRGSRADKGDLASRERPGLNDVLVAYLALLVIEIAK